jgi:SAM-dependent methyltransferase
MKFDQQYTDYQLNRSVIRKMIRKGYLYYHRSLGIGTALDFGCGIGELLSILPEGSRGLEVNPASVKYCQSQGLNVDSYDAKTDDYQLKVIPANTYQTFYMCEVLEHLDHPEKVLGKILDSCNIKGFNRIILVVPGKKGFAFDPTHKIFIDKKFLNHHGFARHKNWRLSQLSFFPFNFKKIGEYFTYNQTVVVFNRR